MLISAVLIEPEAEVALRDGLVLHHAHVWTARCVRSPADNTHNLSMEFQKLKDEKKLKWITGSGT